MNHKPFKTLSFLFFLFFWGFTFFLFQPAKAQATLSNTATDSYYRTGLELYDKQKYGAAQQAFQEYIRRSNDRRGSETMAVPMGNQSANLKVVDAEYYAGICALYLFNPDAEMQMERFIAAHPQHPKAIFAYYELGQFYYAKKDYNKAVEYFEKVDTEQLNLEQTIALKFKLAYTYFSKQDFEKAGRLFGDLKRSNHQYTAQANYYSGFINYKLGKYDDALADLKKAEKEPAFQNEVPYMMANVYYKQQRYDELLAYAESVLPESDASSGKTPGGKTPGGAPPGRSSPGGAPLKNADEFFLLTAESYYRKGNYAKAAPYFKQYASANRSKPAADIQYRIAYAQYQTKDYATAAQSFKNIAAARDTLGQYAAYYLGMAYLKSNNKAFALTAFDQARKGKYNKELQEEAAFNYVKVQYDLGNNADAIASLKDFLKTYPNTRHESEANELLGEAYLNSNNYNEAITHIENLKTRTPRTEAAYQRVTYNQGVTSFNSERFPEAVSFFDKSLSSSKEGELVLAANFWKGEAYSAARKYDDAINSYGTVFRKAEEGLKSNTEDYALKSRYGIGYAYYNKKEYDKALTHFREYTTLLQNATNKQNYTDALIRLADCYYVAKNYEEAVRTYDLAINQNMVDKDYATYQKGIILGIQGKDVEAKKTLDNLAQFPKSRYAADALFQKAQIIFEKGDYEGAIAQYTKLMEQFPNSGSKPYALQRRATAYGNLQQYDKAIADYQQILNNFGNSKVANSALLGLQEALNSAGRSEEFNAALVKYKQNNPQDNALENVELEAAKGLYFSEKYQKAVESLQNYLKTYPNGSLSYDARFYLGESYYRLNDRPNALKYHNAVVAENRSPNVSKSISRLAELELADKNYDSAIRYYLTALNAARNKKEQSASWLGLMDAYYQLAIQQPARYDSVLFYADEIINKGNTSVNAQNRALLYRGKAYYAQEKYDQATDEFLRTVNSAKDENAAEAQYLIGETKFKQGQYKESLDALFELNQKFGSYEKWRGRAFLLIADNYVALNETFQAKATLTSIIDKSPDKQVVEEAKVKLKALEDKQ